MATKKTTVKKAIIKKATPSKTKATPKAVASKKVAVTPAKKAPAQPKKAATAKKAVAENNKKAAAASKKTDVKKAVVKKATTTKKVVKTSLPAKKATATAKPKKAAEAKIVKKQPATAKPVAKKTVKPVVKAVSKATAKPKETEKTVKKAVGKQAKSPIISKPPAIKAGAEKKEAKSSSTSGKVKKETAHEQVIAVREMESKKSGNPKKDHELVMEIFKPATRSLLSGVGENTGPVYRYSDEDLYEFKALILKRLENARKELVYLQGLITRKDEAGTEDTDNRFNHMEDGSGAMEREQLSQLAGRQIQFISHLENALVRIENKTYGICRVTGKLISKARLRAVPHATLSIEAKNGMKR